MAETTLMFTHQKSSFACVRHSHALRVSARLCCAVICTESSCVREFMCSRASPCSYPVFDVRACVCTCLEMHLQHSSVILQCAFHFGTLLL